MSLFHTHKWEEEARWYNPPYTRAFEATRASEEMMQKIMFGFTSVEIRCSLCGDMKCVELHGDSAKPKDLVTK